MPRIIADANGRNVEVFSPTRYNKSLSSGWKPNDPPPPGYGIVYVIQHYHKGKYIGRYIGLSRRACAKRWAEHILEAQGSLVIAPRKPLKGQKKRDDIKAYQYESSTSKPLQTAMTIAMGRQREGDFSKNFSFHIIGLFSLFKLDNVESTLIKVGPNVTAPRTYDKVYQRGVLRSYNYRNEPGEIPGNNFFGKSSSSPEKRNELNSINFTLQVLALDAYINHEWETEDGGPDYLKISSRTPEEIYEAIFTYFINNKKIIPNTLKDNANLRKAIIRILKFKIIAGTSGYLMFQNMPYLSIKEMNIGVSIFFGSASGMGKKKGEESEAIKRIERNKKEVDEFLKVPQNKQDRLFGTPKDAERHWFKAVDEFYKNSLNNAASNKRKMAMERAIKDLEDLQIQIVKLLAKSFEQKNVKKANEIQQEANKLIEQYRIKFSTLSYSDIVQAFIVVDKK
jgi:hypothetical protein